MYLKSILFCSTLSLAVVHCQDIISRCRELGYNGYANLLEQQPDLLASYQARADSTVWVVSDAVVEAALGNNTNQKRAVSVAQLASQSSHLAPTPYTKRQMQLASSNAETMFIYLDDPEYVNLGPGQPGRMVKSFTGTDSLSEATYQIASGLGSVISQTRGPFKFDRGVIYEVEGFFTLPSIFSETIQYIGRATDFYKAVVKAELKDFFDNTAACTVFAPVDHDKHDKHYMYKIDPKKHIVCNFIGFSPELYPGVTYYSAAGTPINVTIADDGTKRVNGLRILTSDISMKNGVTHLIEKPFDYMEGYYTSESTVTVSL